MFPAEICSSVSFRGSQKTKLSIKSDSKATVCSVCQFVGFCPMIFFHPVTSLPVIQILTFLKLTNIYVSRCPRIAIICAPQSGFCFGTSNPRGPLALKIRHLKTLGFTPVLVRPSSLNICLHSCIIHYCNSTYLVS